MLAGKALPLGTRGERYAAAYLRKQGMRVIARNRTHGRGEIDLIAVEKEWLVFVEVRTRASDEYMKPELSIRHEKRRTLVATAKKLMRKHGRAGRRPRIDVVAIVWPAGAKKPASVTHYRGAIALGEW